MKELLASMASLCVGIAIYNFFTNGSLDAAWIDIYWVCFGGGFVAVRFKVWRSNTDIGKE